MHILRTVDNLTRRTIRMNEPTDHSTDSESCDFQLFRTVLANLQDRQFSGRNVLLIEGNFVVKRLKNEDFQHISRM